MGPDFHEFVIGGVLLAPFVADMVAALAIILLLRPVLQLVGFSRMFSQPSIAELGLYVIVLGSLVLLT